jgi:type III pantothenate kinase
MTLLLDIGNSSIKWASLAGDRLMDPGAVVYRHIPVPEALALVPRVDGADRQVIAASVADRDLTQAVLAAATGGHSHKLIVAATEDAAMGVKNGYKDWRQLGVDRWLALLAAFGRYRCAVCIADVGTAVTVDLMNDSGMHFGGLIVPGLELMRDALYGKTHGIPRAAELSSHSPVSGMGVAQDTDSGVRAGCVRAIAALLENCAASLATLESPSTVVVTGGAAPAVLESLRIRTHHRPHLVLEGLALRYAGVLPREV